MLSKCARTLMILCVSGCCMVEGTHVATPSGEVPVESLKVGDRVICSSGPVDQMGVITAIHRGWAHRYVEIETQGHDRPLRVTHGHPVAAGSGFRAAGRLKPGDSVRTTQGPAEISSVRTVRKLVRVYDITVEPHHTLLADGILVHNKTPAPDPPTQEEVADTWVGQAVSEDQSYRLELRPDGTGMFAISFTTAAARSYEVASWTLDFYTVSMELRAVDPQDPPIRLRGWSYRHWPYLDLETDDGSGVWRHVAQLERESAVFEGNEARQ